MAKVTQSKFSDKKNERLAQITKLNRKRYERMEKIHKAIKKESETPGYYAGARGTKGSPGAIAQLVVKGIPKLAKKGWK